MSLSRRQFLILAAGTSAVAGCQSVPEGGVPAPAQSERVVNAGPASQYAADGVYGRYSNLGFFVVRKGETLEAFSAICTHKKCKLTAEKDRSFYCKCHGSTFDPDGKVTNGPAKRDLPIFPASVDENGQLLVKIPAR